MKHSQKVALVPIEQLMSPDENMNQKPTHSNSQPARDQVDPTPIRPPTPPFVPRDILKDGLTDLDSKMKSIVQDTSMSPEEKVIRYNSTLEEYLLFADKYHNREEAFIPRLKPPTSLESHDDVMPERDKHIISSLPISYQKNGDILLKYLRDAGTSWREDGTVIHNGHEIDGTNIKDLVHYVLRHKRRNAPEPTGITHFESLLKASNLPEDIVPWKKVFERKRNNPIDIDIHEQHGQGKIKRWCKY